MNEKKLKNVLTEFRVSDNIYIVVAEIRKSTAPGWKASRACLEESDEKYFKKVLDKRNSMRYYIKADSHRALIKSRWEGSVP